MSKPYCRVILILLTVACGVCAVVTAPIALLTAAMAFDAPDSDYQLWAWIVFFVILSIPLWFVIGAAAGWAFYIQDWRRTSLVLAATPLGGPRQKDFGPLMEKAGQRIAFETAE